jgi:hypothetical protein
MLVGTSLGGCLQSLLRNEVSVDDVLCIITRTSCADIDSLMHVVEVYHEHGNKFAITPANYDLSQFDIDDIKDLARSLYECGKIFQPRLISNSPGFLHPELSRDQLWLEIAPKPTESPAVIKAYEQYKMLRTLTDA